MFAAQEWFIILASGNSPIGRHVKQQQQQQNVILVRISTPVPLAGVVERGQDCFSEASTTATAA